MAKLFAPILAFTCDEIWQAMPHREEDDPRNILLNRMPAVKNANLTIKEGEFFVIMGLSGSGKSTLLRCINRLIEPTKGQVLIKDVYKRQVVEYDKINISPTIGREDGTFGFGFFEYDTDLSFPRRSGAFHRTRCNSADSSSERRPRVCRSGTRRRS